jgi:hypothetical protein
MPLLYSTWRAPTAGRSVVETAITSRLPAGSCCCSPQERKAEEKRRTERKNIWLNFSAAQQAAVLFDYSA